MTMTLSHVNFILFWFLKNGTKLSLNVWLRFGLFDVLGFTNDVWNQSFVFFILKTEEMKYFI